MQHAYLQLCVPPPHTLHLRCQPLRLRGQPCHHFARLLVALPLLRQLAAVPLRLVGRRRLLLLLLPQRVLESLCQQKQRQARRGELSSATEMWRWHRRPPHLSSIRLPARATSCRHSTLSRPPTSHTHL